MDSLTIQSSSGQYSVHVGTKIRHNLAALLEKNYQQIMIITDSSVAELYLEDIIESLSGGSEIFTTVIPAGEQSKSKDVYFDLITDCLEANLDRHSLIIALGGGVVGDLAGFVAATYMRGIDYVQVPTTILAHDSSVGGKVAINHPEGKNMIGSFYPPSGVIYDVETLYTLPESEIRSGYAEIVKHGLISDEIYFLDVVDNASVFKLSDTMLMDHIRKGIAVKAEIVQQDEKETGIRQFLNFGHTLGHALEAELGYGKITHGEAVAVGMLFAIRVSEHVYAIELPYDRLLKWLEYNRYPLQFKDIDIPSIIHRMKKDKKARDKTVQMVLLKGIGKPSVEKIADNDLEKLLIRFFNQNAEL
ncbi:3-dehydroquinate synthase [Sediminibacillus massiliensis]|uniref:3-dehydroquinate synthase n=1 Tax=Sediminibacillus massiliensis TaxID=1926277 RepID=UPI0009886C88|nr:3-dehydroquinate synthase [Sediminibacillus massiliensis]